MEGNLRQIRGFYLFDLAVTCHCPAPVVDSLTVIDFARYVTGLDQMRRT